MGEQSRASLAIIMNRGGEIAVQVRHRRLYRRLSRPFRLNTPTTDGIVHPSSAALPGSRIEIKIKQADQFFLPAPDSEKLDVGVPELRVGCFHRCNYNVVQILHEPEHAP